MKQKLLILACFFSITVFSQSREISGRITESSTGDPITGANVVIKGTTKGTVSDSDGRFSLTIGENQNTLIVSFVGYQTKEEQIEVKKGQTVNLKLQIAQCSSAPASVLEKLALDSDIDVREAVARNLSTPASVLMKLALGKVGKVIAMLLKR